MPRAKGANLVKQWIQKGIKKRDPRLGTVNPLTMSE